MPSYYHSQRRTANCQHFFNVKKHRERENLGGIVVQDDYNKIIKINEL